MSNRALAGLRVLVTRPPGPAEAFARAVEAGGGQAMVVPAVEIEARDPQRIREELERLPRAPKPLFIFVSVPAVRDGLQSVTDIFGPAGILEVAAVGAQTAERLKAAGCRKIIRPANGSGSEALLEALADQALAGRTIVILRGQDGRELLASALTERGARVHPVSVYERRRPASGGEAITHALARGEVNVITVTSAGIYRNLLDMLDDEARERLRDTALLVPSQRVVTMVRKDGARGQVILAKGADDAALLAALSDWRNQEPAADAREEKRMSEDKQPAPGPDTAKSGVGTGQRDDRPKDPPASPKTRPAPERQTKSTAETPVLEKQPQVVVEKKSGGTLAALAFLLALGAAAASAWLWWQNQQAPATNTDNALSDTRTALQNEVTRLEQAIAGLDDQFSDLLSDQQGAALKLRGIDELNMRLQGLASELETMRGVSNSARQSWAVAEAAYFLQAANTALQLGRNVGAASNALAAADDRLASIGDPRLLPVREAIASERQALAALPDTDVTGIALTLGRLAERAPELATLSDDPAAYATPAQPADSDDQGGIERARRVLGDAMKSMVTVRRTDQQASALLAPEEEFFLARNLELQLLTARLALLREQPELFTQSIDTSLGWLREFFDQSAPEVASTIETLEQLRTTAVRRSLPDISGSLTLLRSMQDAPQ